MSAFGPGALRRATDDIAFDQVFPPALRNRSSMHWTPLDVARRAVTLLCPEPCRVLDVGCGVGKLCLIGASMTDSMWVGVEREPELVRAAQAAAATLGVTDRTRFVDGDMTCVDWSLFDAFYLFNPFAEILLSDLGDPLERRDHYVAHVELVQSQLARVVPGTRVVTYHGFGGDMPRCFDLVERERAREDELHLWIRRDE